MACEITLTRPLTRQEIYNLTKDGEHYLNCLVKVSLNSLIVETIEGLNSMMDCLILPPDDRDGLTDIGYAVHEAIPGDEPRGSGSGFVILRVTADANEYLDDSWEDDDDGNFWETSYE